jgi:hypothetical protein
MPDIVLGAKQIKNPKGIKPQLDTDNPSLPTPRYANMDISNPKKSNIIPTPTERKHPVDEWFGRGIKRSNGPYIPRSDIQISDN